MFFQNPLVWWLAPLIFVPFLIHFRRFFQQHTQELPSLYFLQRLVRSRLKDLNRYFLLEIILEMLIIFLCLFSWSQPTLHATPKGGDKLVLLIDDSPSMRYFHLNASQATEPHATSSALLASVEAIFKQKLFTEIEARRLSALEQTEAQPIATLADLRTFLKNISENPRPAHWQARNVHASLQSLYAPTGIPDDARPVHYLIYSDFKENHFRTTSSFTDNRAVRETQQQLNTAARPAFLYAVAEPSSPYLTPQSLTSRHFFAREKLTLPHTFYYPPHLAESIRNQEIFLEVSLDEKQVFLSKLLPPRPAEPAAAAENAPPTAALHSFKIQSDVILAHPGPHVLSITLKNNDIVLQNDREIVFVYPPLHLTPLSADKRINSYLEALFLYDKRTKSITLAPTPTPSSILLITDPEHARKILPASRLRQQKALVFLSPLANIRKMENVLRNLSGTNIYLSSLEKLNAQSQFFWNERPQTTPRFQTDFLPQQTYLKLSQQRQEAIRPLFTIDNHPVIFIAGEKAFFTFLSEPSLLKAPHPLHLIWFYEALFALNGGKHVIPVYDDHALVRTAPSRTTQLTNLNLALSAPPTNSAATPPASPEITTPLYQAPILANASTIYLVKEPPSEHIAASLVSASTTSEVNLPFLGAATLINKSPTPETPFTAPTAAQNVLSTLTFFRSPSHVAFYSILICLLALSLVLLKRLLVSRTTA